MKMIDKLLFSSIQKPQMNDWLIYNSKQKFELQIGFLHADRICKYITIVKINCLIHQIFVYDEFQAHGPFFYLELKFYNLRKISREKL